MKVNFKNPKSGEIVSVKVGFSWTCLFFSATLGIPLFLRKLNVWGGIMAAIFISSFIVSSVDPTAGTMIGLISFGLNVYFGFKANSMAAKNYLENGWVFEDQPENIQAARNEWKLAA